MSGASIRAGQAFVEVLLKDKQLQQDMAGLKTKLAAMAATVRAVGASSFTAMNAAASTALASTAASSAVTAASVSAISTAVRSATAAFSGLFRVATGSVAGVAASFIGLGAAVNSFMPKNSPLRGMVSSLLDFSQVAEVGGRRMRLIGGMIGSSFLTGFGRSLERGGMGGMIAKGFNANGISGALTASLGVAFRSARGMLGSLAVGAITAPFRAAFSVVSGSASATVASLTQVATATNSVGAAMARATAPTRGLVGSMFNFAGMASRVFSLASTVGKFAGAIYAAGVAAAGGFASAAADITAKAKETGKSIQALIQEKYGKFSFITPADIKAGNALSQAMKELKQQTAAAFAQLGIAAMPVLKKAVEFMTEATRAVTRFLSENRQLIGIAFSVAGRVAKIAGAVAMVGVALPAVGAAMSALLNPTVLFTGAVTAIAAAFPQVRRAAMDGIGFIGSLFQSALQSATNFFNYLFPNASKVGSTISGTMRGVMDAIQGGSLQAAGEVAMSGLRLAWLEGTEKLQEIFRNAMAIIQTKIAEATLAAQTKWEEAVLVMKNAWQGFSAVIEAAFAPFQQHIDAAKQAWTGLTTFVKTNYQELKDFINGQLEQLYNAWKGVIDRISAAWKSAFGTMEGIITRLSKTLEGLGIKNAVRDAVLNSVPGGMAVRVGVDAANSLTTDMARDERAENQKTFDERIKALNDAHALALKNLAEQKTAADANAKADLEAANRAHQKSLDQVERLKQLDQWRRQQLDKFTGGLNAAKSASSLSSGFGSFSAATAKMQGVAGLGAAVEDAVKQTAEHTGAVAEAMKELLRRPAGLFLT